jgi:molecular chaperone DnaK
LTKLVERNATIPTQQKQTFSTAADNQTAVTVTVYQGERPMAKDNRLLGQFNLEGIPPAPRGVPQIEVEFDIDANGILNVSAKDLGTGKASSVRIEQTAGLSESEIQRMKREADAHAEEDKRQHELAEARNQGEHLCYQLEKIMKENEGKLSDADRRPMTLAIEKVRHAIKGEDLAAIRSAVSELEQASHAFSASLYQTMQTGQTQPQAARGDAGDSPADEAIDAEFEVKS